ncbi:MAG: dipicolinate synthase [Roseburia sp.]|nr:dipicolinate synthase [Roseburia sp.]
MIKSDFSIIGGDRRIARMAPILADKGYHVSCFATVGLTEEKNPKIYHAASGREALEGARVLITGIPMTKGDCIFCEAQAVEISLSELQRRLRKHQTLFGGVIPEAFRQTCEEREINCYDFMRDEPLTLFNAIATAEGAILEALLHKASNLHQSDTLVLGYGRCGKVLADKLRGLSARVTVCTNDRQELALAAALGLDTLRLSDLRQNIRRFEYIFNTIPVCVLKKSCLANVQKNAIIIDIASNQSGADYEAARLLHTDIHFCPGLPGKYASQSCAERLVQYVLQCCGNFL